MELIIERSKLLPILQIVIGVVERRQPLPILANILFSASGDLLRITASDMEVELVSSIKLESPGKVEITLPARKLLDICRALPEDATIRIKTAGDKVQILSGKSRFSLSTLPSHEYPIIDMQEPAAEFTITQEALKDLLEKTAFSMAQQDVRYYLNGLLLELTLTGIRAVATDGHRLALRELEIPMQIKEKLQIIVPRKGVVELIKHLENKNEEITVQITGNHMRVMFADLVFTSKLIDGKFPDYDRVVPEIGDAIVLADRELLKQSLTRASILSNEKYRGIRILLEKNKLRALAHNPEQEEAEEEVEIQYDGAEMEIGFNVSYLLDALAIIKTEKVRISVKDPNSSCLLLPAEDNKCKYVVMPMRL
jgi:DNA polymerase III subunit beta